MNVNTLLTFGKYVNKPLCEVPSDYLAWVVMRMRPNRPELSRLALALLVARYQASQDDVLAELNIHELV